MKSKTSFFNKTVFKKNLTRFAPAWGLYTVFQLMVLVLIVDGNSSHYLAYSIAECAQYMCVFTPCYALLCAQLLFGDLYNARMCNALHALPLRREAWFLTNVASGFVFHLIPTVVAAVLATILIAMTALPELWVIGPLWLLCVNLQFVCFFGIGVLSVFCVGNRFAMAVVYGILNFGSLIAGWLVDTLYTPMYYGVRTNVEPFFWFSPVAQMVEQTMIRVEHVYDGNHNYPIHGEIVLESNFWYLWICAAVGVVLVGLALQLYRKRKLECAGDFMAVKGMEPVFQIVYTLIVGAVFHFVVAEMFGMETMLFLFVGLAVGWFTGRMLLERTPRVFRWKSFALCGILMAVVGASLLIAALDPFGIESWIPETEEVESVSISDGHYTYHDCEVTLEDAEDIEKILNIHQQVLDRLNGEDIVIGPHGVITGGYGGETAMVVTQEIAKEDWETMDYDLALTFTYNLRSGRTVNRYYYVWMGGENGEYIRSLFSSPECVLGREMDAETFMRENSGVVVQDIYQGDETIVYSDEAIRSLYDAILADCEAGTMAQDWDFHNGEDSIYWLAGFESGFGVTVYTDCENTIQWLRDNGFDVDAILALVYG